MKTLLTYTVAYLLIASFGLELALQGMHLALPQLSPADLLLRPELCLPGLLIASLVSMLVWLKIIIK